MAGLNAASDYSKVILILLLVSGVIFVLSFGSPYWSTREDGNSGLWEGCKEGVCYERWNQWVERWVKVSQTFMVLSLIFWSFGTISLLFYVFHKDFEEDKRLVCLSAILTFTAALCILLAVLVWAGGTSIYAHGDNISWAFVFACLDPVFLTIAGFLLVKELRRGIK